VKAQYCDSRFARRRCQTLSPDVSRPSADLGSDRTLGLRYAISLLSISGRAGSRIRGRTVWTESTQDTCQLARVHKPCSEHLRPPWTAIQASTRQRTEDSQISRNT